MDLENQNKWENQNKCFSFKMKYNENASNSKSLIILLYIFLIVFREAEEDGRRELEKMRTQLETEHNEYKTYAEAQLG